MFSSIEKSLKSSFDNKLVDELLVAYWESKRNFYVGGLRLSAVEGGRFCEAAFRMLQEVTTGVFTPLGAQLNSEAVIKALSQLPHSQFGDSIRLHIPRALRMVYDIRNKRDAAHLADGIDPNVQDATLVIATLDWVLAEFVRIYHAVSPNEAQDIIVDLVTRGAPAVQNFSGFLKVLRTDLKAGGRVLLLLYERGSNGATFEELSNWVHPKMKKNLKTTLGRLDRELAMIHSSGPRFFITIKGVQEVERRKLHNVDW